MAISFPKNNRLGFFRVDANFLDDNYLLWVEIFSRLKLLVVGAKTTDYLRVIEYIGICDLFDEVPKNAPIPEYVLRLFVDSDNKLENVVVEKLD